ncbi:MAG: penicillin-binding protein 2 [Syntrophaceae bacterium]|jgi:penicillin-binding protein 2|nr:penicillin-binding protein 2 [Syntrophaceae bacterium]HOC60914.1 penicillin-binding protein 2 [Smithellaceae bacterium]HQM44209.1 penicillin-binding protein 2 [Smithellaceae bacterium]
MERQFNLGNGPAPADFQQKLKIVVVLLVLALTVLLVRLWYLQMIKGDELKLRSESNAVRFRNIQPIRGLVMDRNGSVLVDNRPSFDVLYMPTKGVNPDMLLQKIKNIYETRSLGFSSGNPFPKTVKPYLPVRLEKNVSMEKIALVETNAVDLPGVYVDVTPIRIYLDGEITAPIIGYTGEVSKEELEKSGEDYVSGDITGKYGIEKMFDSYIRGRRGNELVEVNAFGKVIKNLGRIDPLSGSNVVLTIDARLQKAAWEAFSGFTGSAVVMDPRDGSILAMVSLPSFDPNLFCNGIDREQWQKLQKNPLTPLSNRAISGQYPPGSTYKLIVAAAALEEGIITPSTRISCNGSFTLGNRVFRCWNKHGHGSVNLHQALVGSCDVYFYTVGKMLGVDKIAEYAKRFGLGDVTGIDLASEKKGLVPTREWKLARMKQPWQIGETISISIGQGFNLTTPLQLVRAYAALANGGTLWRPRLVSRIVMPDGSVVKEFVPEKKGAIQLHKQTIAVLNRALWGVVNEPGGTGKAARRPYTDVCGKTGTSQVIGLPQNEKARRAQKITAFHKDHALFVCYAPMKNPEIAVAVVAENAGGGGAVAAPIAQKILNAYFDGKKAKNLPLRQPTVTDS